MGDSDRTPTLEEFRECCDKEWDFLVRDFGFVRSADPMEYNDYSVCFRKGELGVEICGESYGKSASCHLVRGKDRLYWALIIPASQRVAPKQKRGPLGQLGQVKAIATWVKAHASDFLSGDLDRFDAALAEWKRITAPRPVSQAQLEERARSTAVTSAGHENRRRNYAEVVRLLEPHEKELSLHQRRMLETAREKLKNGPG